jgi:hypothetical protein
MAGFSGVLGGRLVQGASSQYVREFLARPHLGPLPLGEERVIGSHGLEEGCPA